MTEIRPATEADIPLIRDLAGRIWRAAYGEMLSGAQIEYMLGWMYSEEALRDDLRRGIFYGVIISEASPVGYLACGAESATEWKLHKLYVLPEHQGRGLAQHAIRHTAGLAASHGAERVTLNVNKHNARAIRSYERAGFCVVASVVHDIGGGFVMDDFVMQRDLPLAR